MQHVPKEEGENKDTEKSAKQVNAVLHLPFKGQNHNESFISYIVLAKQAKHQTKLLTLTVAA